MDNSKGIGLFETITLFTTWIEGTEWAEAFDFSARLTLGIEPRKLPGGIIPFLPTIQDELLSTVVFLVVEDFIGKAFYDGLPLAQFIDAFDGYFSYKSLDWVSSLPGSELTIYKVTKRDDSWLTAMEVLRPDRGIYLDPNVKNPADIGDIRLERIVETELSPRSSPAGFTVPPSIWERLLTKYQQKVALYEAMEDKERMGKILTFDIISEVITTKLNLE